MGSVPHFSARLRRSPRYRFFPPLRLPFSTCRPIIVLVQCFGKLIAFFFLLLVSLSCVLFFLPPSHTRFVFLPSWAIRFFFSIRLVRFFPAVYSLFMTTSASLLFLSAIPTIVPTLCPPPFSPTHWGHSPLHFPPPITFALSRAYDSRQVEICARPQVLIKHT